MNKSYQQRSTRPLRSWMAIALSLFFLTACTSDIGNSASQSDSSTSSSPSLTEDEASESPTNTASGSSASNSSSGRSSDTDADAEETDAADSDTTPQTDRPYINRLLPEAQRIQEAYGIPLETTISIAIQETGWGEHEIGQNNHFGLRCASDDCITLNGVRYETCPDDGECFNMFAESINELSEGNPSDLRVIYNNGYATSRGWLRKVRRIRRQVRKSLEEAGISTNG